MWGLNWPLGLDQEPRFRALRQILTRGDYDVVLLQEVWFRWQYDILHGAMPFASRFESYNACSGTELGWNSLICACCCGINNLAIAIRLMVIKHYTA